MQHVGELQKDLIKIRNFKTKIVYQQNHSEEIIFNGLLFLFKLKLNEFHDDSIEFLFKQKLRLASKRVLF